MRHSLLLEAEDDRGVAEAASGQGGGSSAGEACVVHGAEPPQRLHRGVGVRRGHAFRAEAPPEVGLGAVAVRKRARR